MSKLWHKLLAVSHKSPPNSTLLISQLKALFTFNVKCSLTLQIWTSKCNLFGPEHFTHNFAGCGPRRVAAILEQHNLKQAKTSFHMRTFWNWQLWSYAESDKGLGVAQWLVGWLVTLSPIWLLPPLLLLLSKTCHQILSKFLKSRLTLAWYEAYRANYVKAAKADSAHGGISEILH